MQFAIAVAAFLLTRLVRTPIERIVNGQLFRSRTRRLSAIDDLSNDLETLRHAD